MKSQEEMTQEIFIAAMQTAQGLADLDKEQLDSLIKDVTKLTWNISEVFIDTLYELEEGDVA